MKFYSENLDKLFDTEEALKQAEAALENKEQEKKRRTQELDAARQAAKGAEKKYAELLSRYCKDYGQYAYSSSGDEIGSDALARLLEQLGLHIL